MVNTAGSKLRGLLKAKNHIASIVDFGDAQLFGEAITYCCLLFLNSASKSPKSFTIYNASQKPEDVNLWQKAIFTINELGEEGWNFGQSSTDLIEKIRKHAGRVLGDIAHPHYCLFTGLNEAFIISESQLRQKMIEHEIVKPLLRGQDVDRWQTVHNGLYILYPYKQLGNKVVPVQLSLYPNAMAHLSQFRDALIKRIKFTQKIANLEERVDRWYEYIDPRSTSQFDPVKIITPEISNKCSFVVDTDGYYCLNKAYVINIDPQQVNPYYLTAILNSSVTFYHVRSTATKLANGFFEFITQHLKPIPVANITFTLSPEQRAYYLEKARNLYTYCLDKHDQDCVLGFVDHHLAREPEESDVVHDLLAMLAEQMIHLNKEKRAAQRELLDWLVATLKIAPDKDGRKGIDALTGKSKLLDYPGDYQKGEPPLATGELLEILQKNRGRLGVSLSDAALVDRVRREYEESLERVLPLKERLARTDRLIDAVVYRLYGLTEEEIGVVEGKV